MRNWSYPELSTIKETPNRDSHGRSTWTFTMKSILIQTVVLSIMVQIGAYRLPGLGHFRKSNEPHPTIEIGKFLYSLRNVHDLFKTSSNQMQGTRDGPTIPPSSQISINEGKTVISIGASEKKRSSRSQFFFFSFFTSKTYTNLIVNSALIKQLISIFFTFRSQSN